MKLMATAVLVLASICAVLLAEVSGYISFDANKTSDTTTCLGNDILWSGELSAVDIHRMIKIITLCADVGVKPVVRLNTSGGEIAYATSFVENIRHLGLQNAFSLQAFGYVDSAGAILLLATDARLGTKSARFGFHKLTINASKEDAAYKRSLRHHAIDTSTQLVQKVLGRKAASMYREHLTHERYGCVYSAQDMLELGFLTHIMQ